MTKFTTFYNFIDSQTNPKINFDFFSNNFEMNLGILAQKNLFIMTDIGNFKAKSKTWFNQDKNSFEGKTIESITSQSGLYQLINEPTHLLENSSLCMDLIITSQPNLEVESGEC